MTATASSTGYTDAAEMIAAGGLDCVFVLNSDEYHAECTIAALDAGLHVLVEKPMCLSPREAEEIIAARDRSGTTVMVAYMRRFAPAFTEAVASGCRSWARSATRGCTTSSARTG